MAIDRYHFVVRGQRSRRSAANDPIGRTVTSHEDRQSLEILPQLREKYPRYLRPEIISVKFVQSRDRCHLEITTIDDSRDDLVDEVSNRTDLAFVVGSLDGDRPSFSSQSSLIDNAHRFVADFDVVSIINCTKLFTQEAAMRIDAYWRQHGVASDRV